MNFGMGQFMQICERFFYLLFNNFNLESGESGILVYLGPLDTITARLVRDVPSTPYISI